MKIKGIEVNRDKIVIGFDNGKTYDVTDMNGVNSMNATAFLMGVFGITTVRNKGTAEYVMKVSIDQSVQDWAIAINAYQKTLIGNDALFEKDDGSYFSEEYLQEINAQVKIINALAGLFEDLKNGD